MSREREEVIRKVVKEELKKRDTPLNKTLRGMGICSLIYLVGQFIAPGVIPSEEDIVIALRQVASQSIENLSKAPSQPEEPELPSETPLFGGSYPSPSSGFDFDEDVYTS